MIGIIYFGIGGLLAIIIMAVGIVRLITENRKMYYSDNTDIAYLQTVSEDYGHLSLILTFIFVMISIVILWPGFLFLVIHFITRYVKRV